MRFRLLPLSCAVGVVLGILAGPVIERSVTRPRPVGVFAGDAAFAREEARELIGYYASSLRQLSTSVSQFASLQATTADDLLAQSSSLGTAIECHNTWFGEFERRWPYLEARLQSWAGNAEAKRLLDELERIHEVNWYGIRPTLNVLVLPIILADQGTLRDDEIRYFEELRRLRGRDLQNILADRVADLERAGWPATGEKCPKVMAGNR